MFCQENNNRTKTEEERAGGEGESGKGHSVDHIVAYSVDVVVAIFHINNNHALDWRRAKENS